MSAARPERKWLSVSVYPALIIGFGGFGTWLMQQGVAPATMQGSLTLPVIMVVALLERVHPYREDWNRSHGDLWTDFLHLILSATAVQQLVATALLAAADHLEPSLPRLLGGAFWPSGWPFVLQVVWGFLLVEFFLYWLHRAEHEWAWLWPLHAVHHSAPRLYWMNATRFHPIDEALLALFGTVPLLLLGAPLEVTALGAVLAGVHGAMQHANVDVKLGPLNYLVSMAELHRVHHSPFPERANSNYGGNLIVWDILFGTLRRPEPVDETYGVGLGDASPPVPPGYLGQMLYPFNPEGVAEGPTARTQQPAR